MNRERAMTAGGVNIIAGLWLIVSPFILGFSGTTLSTNDIIFGIVLTILAIIQLSSVAAEWVGWANGVLGLWVLISPFVLAAATATSTWNNVIAGLIVAVLSVWGTTSATIGHGHPKMG